MLSELARPLSGPGGSTTSLR